MDHDGARKEFTVDSGHSSRAFSFGVGLRGQAQWLTAAFRVADQAPYVAGLGWFTLLDEPATVKQRLSNGLMTYRGRRKPAFAAFRDAP